MKGLNKKYLHQDNKNSKGCTKMYTVQLGFLLEVR